MNRVGIQDVARHAGVSTATVSYIINNKKSVSAETRKRVERSIKELGYKPNAIAQSFKTGKKNLIAFIVPDIANNFFSTLIEEIEGVLASRHYKLMILNTKETKIREIESINAVSSGIVDGIILASTMDSYSEIKSILPQSIPTILIDRELKDCPADSITVNCHDAVCRGVEDLIGKGHRKIGYITGLMHISTTVERLDAYKETMQQHGLYDPALIRIGDSMSHCVKGHLDSLIDAGCTAVVITNNVMATEAMLQMLDEGIRPGRDIEILGFRDSDQAQYGLQHMDLIIQPTKELGKVAGRRILDRISDPAGLQQRIELQAIFMPREKT